MFANSKIAMKNVANLEQPGPGYMSSDCEMTQNSSLQWPQIAVTSVNPFTLKGDQFQISSAVSPEIFHHTVWRTWLFTAYPDERWFYTSNSHYLSYRISLQPFHSQEWSISNFPCILTRNITSHSRKNLAFHHLHWDERWSYYQFSQTHSYISLLKGWESVLIELGGERVNTMCFWRR